MTPRFALQMPTIAPQSAPKATPASMATTAWITGGISTAAPTIMAPKLPTINCPSAPILKMPVRKAKATAIPVRMIGTASTMVQDRYLGRPKAPKIMTLYASMGFTSTASKIIAPTKRPRATDISV
ncbi:Uncharacterised protein [Aedoeadaptatus ivorii]|uniref:Uncharacterized protein n=1 Tax=Aedoeadaptatus ivorii TaxID=54006 RepID=A0A448V0Q4_9FIRM|nr:Uncharacterised protein [Peptoniphilus ivorii]